MAFPLNVIAMYVMFAVWFAITLGVLMGMDVMECVLHVLRLHWIEFDSKFYKGEGHAFVPYRHDTICSGEDDSLGSDPTIEAPQACASRSCRTEFAVVSMFLSGLS